MRCVECATRPPSFDAPAKFLRKSAEFNSPASSGGALTQATDGLLRRDAGVLVPGHNLTDALDRLGHGIGRFLIDISRDDGSCLQVDSDDALDILVFASRIRGITRDRRQMHMCANDPPSETRQRELNTATYMCPELVRERAVLRADEELHGAMSPFDKE